MEIQSFAFAAFKGVCRPFKGGNEGLTVVLEMSGAGRIFLQQAGDFGLWSRAITGIVKGEEQFESKALGYRERICNRLLICCLAVRHIEGKCINVGFLS